MFAEFESRNYCNLPWTQVTLSRQIRGIDFTEPVKRRLIDGVKKVTEGVQRIRREIEHLDRQLKTKTRWRIKEGEKRRISRQAEPDVARARAGGPAGPRSVPGDDPQLPQDTLGRAQATLSDERARSRPWSPPPTTRSASPCKESASGRTHVHEPLQRAQGQPRGPNGASHLSGNGTTEEA